MSIARQELRRIVQALPKAGRFDGAVYLCGYSVEIALKARICQTLKWSQYPETNSEFQQFQSFRTHNLETLLVLSAQQDRIRANYSIQWSDVIGWNPEMRYRPVGSAAQADAATMITSARELLRTLL